MPELTIKTIIEIFVLAIGIYFILRVMVGTRGLGILKGLLVSVMVVVVVLACFAYLLDSQVLRDLQRYIVLGSVVSILVIFQPELRRALIRMGQNPFVQRFVEDQVINQLIKAVGTMSETRTGALLALEREIGLGAFIEAGTRIDANVDANLLCTIFFNGTPLHDGGVIIQGDRIAAAGTLFPLSENPSLASELGTRHRAGLGLTEESDALVIIVSEESGRISFAARGQLMTGVTLERLREMLTELYSGKEGNES